jgi:hypothetical protein
MSNERQDFWKIVVNEWGSHSHTAQMEIAFQLNRIGNLLEKIEHNLRR